MPGRAGAAPSFSSRARSLHRVSPSLHYGSMGDCPADSSPIALHSVPKTHYSRSLPHGCFTLAHPPTGRPPRLTNPCAAMTLTPPMPTPDPSASAGMHCSALLRRHVSAIRPAESLTMAPATSPRMSLTASIASSSALLSSLLRQCRAGPAIRALPRPVRSSGAKAPSMWGVPPSLPCPDAHSLPALRCGSSAPAPRASPPIPSHLTPRKGAER